MKIFTIVAWQLQIMQVEEKNFNGESKISETLEPIVWPIFLENRMKMCHLMRQ